MKFSVNETKKKDVYRTIKSNDSLIQIISRISKYLFLSGIAFGSLFAVIAYGLRNVKNFNMDWCVFYGGMITASVLTLSLILYISTYKLAAAYTTDLSDEELSITDDFLEYTYSSKRYSLKNTVQVNLADLNDIKYESQLSKIVLTGRVYSDNYPQRHLGSNSTTIFVIYDYFEPSLKSVLQKYPQYREV